MAPKDIPWIHQKRTLDCPERCINICTLLWCCHSKSTRFVRRSERTMTINAGTSVFSTPLARRTIPLSVQRDHGLELFPDPNCSGSTLSWIYRLTPRKPFFPENALQIQKGIRLNWPTIADPSRDRYCIPLPKHKWANPCSSLEETPVDQWILWIRHQFRHIRVSLLLDSTCWSQII